MNSRSIRTILNDISFCDNNMNMSWDWEIKETTIFDNVDGEVLEDGFSIRVTFLRPDIETNEIGKGYGRWMFISENITKDGLVKTAWLCVKLVIEHELMESFLFENKRIFDPHKTIEDLSINTREGSDVNKNNDKPSPTEKEKDIIDTNNVIYEQNIKNTYKEILALLEKHFKKLPSERDHVKIFETDFKYYFFLNEKTNTLIYANNKDKIINSFSVAEKDLSYLKVYEFLIENDLIYEISSPADINKVLNDLGYVSKTEDGIMICTKTNNPNTVLHNELDKQLIVLDGENELIEKFHGVNYTIDKIKNYL